MTYQLSLASIFVSLCMAACSQAPEASTKAEESKVLSAEDQATSEDAFNLVTPGSVETQSAENYDGFNIGAGQTQTDDRSDFIRINTNIQTTDPETTLPKVNSNQTPNTP